MIGLANVSPIIEPAKEVTRKGKGGNKPPVVTARNQALKEPLAIAYWVKSTNAPFSGNNPEDLPYFKFRNIISSIEGTYKTYRDLYTVKVEPKGNMIMVHLENDDGEMDFPIQIRDIDNLVFTIPVGFPELQPKIRFKKDKKTGKIAQLVYDRYIYHKK